VRLHLGSSATRRPVAGLLGMAGWLDDALRRFTRPWDIEDNGACFIVHDANR
jgi:hypothetical protein